MPSVMYSLYNSTRLYCFLGKHPILSIQAIKELIFLECDAVALIFPYNYSSEDSSPCCNAYVRVCVHVVYIRNQQYNQFCVFFPNQLLGKVGGAKYSNMYI